jgi:hypothetical protein
MFLIACNSEFAIDFVFVITQNNNNVLLYRNENKLIPTSPTL